MHKRYISRSTLVLLTTVLVLFSVGDAEGQLDDFDPIVRLAASNVFTAECSLSGAVDYSTNGIPGLGTPEGRLAGLSCQRTDMLSGVGDPFVRDADGAIVNATADAQAYADAAVSANAPSASDERRLARAEAAVLAIRDGFAIVPGGPSEAFNRIQTCLDGNLETNQNNLVNGTALDCSEPLIALAVANLIAPGFYLQFGTLVGIGCDDFLAQATGGTTSASRWAASLAYVSGCDPDLGALAADGANVELSFAAIGPLAAAGGAAGSGGNLDLANAFAAGLAIANSVTTDATGNPTAGALGNLFQFSLANFGTDGAMAAMAPLARHFFGPGELRLCVHGHVIFSGGSAFWGWSCAILR